MLLALVTSQGVVRPHRPWPRARIKATLYTWNPMDYDNAIARLKWCVDFLVERGLILSDTDKVLEWEKPEQHVDRKHPRVEIELTEVS